MQIKERHTVVEMDYALKDDEARLHRRNSNPASRWPNLHGHRNIIPGLEAALEGKAAGDSVQVRIRAPARGVGEVNPALEQVVPRERFQGVEQLRPGMQIPGQHDQGRGLGPASLSVRRPVTVDGKPRRSARKHLNFDVTIQGVREATEEEKAHGHIQPRRRLCCGGRGQGRRLRLLRRFRFGFSVASRPLGAFAGRWSAWVSGALHNGCRVVLT